MKTGLLVLVAVNATAQMPQPPVPNFNITPPHVETMTETAMRAERVRQLRLQNELLQQQLRERQAKSERPRGSQVPAATGSESVGAYEVHQMTTYSCLNGRAWKSFSQPAKLTYFIGVTESLNWERVPNAPKYMPPSLTFEEITTAIDRLYAEPENLLIPVIEAIHIVTMKSAGSPQSLIDAELSMLRSVANQAPERKEQPK